MVKGYGVLHFTYFRGLPNRNGEIRNKLTSDVHSKYRVDRLVIIEPHKFKQGSVTMLRKVKEPSY